MLEVVVASRIAVPREQVFDAYTDHVSWSEWANIGRVRLEREGVPPPNGVGCVRVITAGGISVHEEVIAFERPYRMAYRIVRGGLPIRNHHGEVSFEEDAGATELVWRCRFESTIPGLGFLWKAVITKVFRDTLHGLRHNRFGQGR